MKLGNVQEVLRTASLLDSNGDHDGFLAFAQAQRHQPSTLSVVIRLLLPRMRLRSAYTLSLLLTGWGYQDPLIALTFAIGNLVFGHAQATVRGLLGWRDQVTRLPDKERIELSDEFMAPVLNHLMQTTLRTATDPQLAVLFNILQTAVPSFRGVLPEGAEWSRVTPDPALAVQQRPGASPASLLEFPALPGGSSRPCRRVVVAMQSHQFWGRPRSRPFLHVEPALMASMRALQAWPRPMCLGPRLVAAMNAYGWQADLCAAAGFDWAEDHAAILAQCRRKEAELLLLDDSFVLDPGGEVGNSRSRLERLALLRLQLPELKVAVILHDPRALELTLLSEIAALVDLILDPGSPALPVWQQTALQGKVLHMPMPTGGTLNLSQRALQPRLVFAGQKVSYAPFWLRAAEQMGLPIMQTGEAFDPQEWVQLDSYLQYRKNLAKEPCHLRLARDPHHRSPVADQSLEILLGGSLLVQESSPHMQRYFVPGEHYLEFSTLTELAAIVRFITERREEAEAIRRAGRSFARKQYGDKALVGYLDRRLFPLEQEMVSPFRTTALPVQPAKPVSFEYISVQKWCREVAPSELVAGRGNLVCNFPGHVVPQPSVPVLGLRARGEGYEELFPCSEVTFGAALSNCYFDLNTRRVIQPRPPFVARLENVRLEFPGFGLLLDRHLVMEESYHDKTGTQRTTEWFTNNIREDGARRNFRCEVPVGKEGAPAQMNLDVKYYLDRPVDQYITGPVLLISGPAWANYHHWLLEMLPRLWCLQEIPELQSVPLLIREPLLPHQEQTLRALGIGPERIRLFTGSMLQVETLFFASTLAAWNCSVENATWLQDHLIPAFGVETISPPRDLLYISRAKCQWRRVANEAEVAACLQARGFRVLYPEDLPVKEQIETFRNARMVVLTHGSAGINMIFSQPGTIYLDLDAELPYAEHFVYASVGSHCQYGGIPCCADGNGHMIVNIDVLSQVVDKALEDCAL
ncbi:MAG: glycosyltransferase 61 family protein [Magnetococcus sp. MYC-9]